MPKIQTQRDARAVQKLPFCYVCATSFAPGTAKNVDHIPPEAAFLAEDRENFPLTLPTHSDCNHVFNLEDETLGQLIGLRHTRGAGANRLEIRRAIDATGDSYTFLKNINLRAMIRRWVTAFHAALYQEPLSPNVLFTIQTPMPSANLVDTYAVHEAQRQQFVMIAEHIAMNDRLGLIDAIISNNSKMKYTCYWQKTDNGQWLAFFRLDLYDWSQLGDIRHFQERPCVGSYGAPSYLPALATQGTELWSVRA